MMMLLRYPMVIVILEWHTGNAFIVFYVLIKL